MSKFDQLKGRIQQAAGDVLGDASMRREGRRRERKGKAKEEAALAEERAEEKASEVADLERSAASQSATSRQQRR